MYTIHHRFMGSILVIGHSLMSCYNPDVVRPQQLTKKDEQETKTTTTIPIEPTIEEEQQEPWGFLPIPNQAPSQTQNP
jgi:hypothetical protein